MCYTIPSLYHKKTAIVISPTVSLMTDQVKKLGRQEIPTTLLGSAQNKDVTLNDFWITMTHSSADVEYGIPKVPF